MTADTQAATTSATHPTTHQGILDFVNEVAAMTQPDRIHWCTGSDEEWTELTEALVSTGTFTRLNPAIKPNSFYAASDPIDVARVEDRTYICSVNERDAGPTNNWMDPEQMKTLMRGLYDGCMRGRTMYVIPFVMGHLDAEKPMFGIEITDSAYVTASMRVMARMGSHVLDRMEELDADFVPALHSVGHPLEPGEADVAWPCNDTKYIVQFPEERAIWSYGSGYGGNALLGKKCYALRIALGDGPRRGLARRAHADPQAHLAAGRREVHRRGVPVGVRQDQPGDAPADDPGLEGRDPRRRHRLDADRRRTAGCGRSTRSTASSASRPAPTSTPTRTPCGPSTRATRSSRTSRSPRTATSGGRAWRTRRPGRRPGRASPGRPESEELSSHANSRYCTPIKQCDILAEEYDDPRGVPIDAILFGGRRKTTVPLVFEARDWTHGTFLGATLSSETTAAAVGAVGVVRRDPMAMLPFIGYNAGDYFNHWISVGKDNDAAKLPRIFYVNWFRRDDEGGFLWPGFGENSRVLKWVVERIEGQAAAVETPIGHVPTPDALDTDGLDMTPEALEAALAVDVDEWKAELPQIQEWFDKFGDDLPAVLWTELDGLRARLGG